MLQLSSFGKYLWDRTSSYLGFFLHLLFFLIYLSDENVLLCVDLQGKQQK